MQYHGTREEQIKQYKKGLKEYQVTRDAAMREANVVIGDRVEYHAIGSWNHVEVFEGVIYLTKSGVPKVKCDNGKRVNWHKGFKKVR